MMDNCDTGSVNQYNRIIVHITVFHCISQVLGIEFLLQHLLVNTEVGVVQDGIVVIPR